MKLSRLPDCLLGLGSLSRLATVTFLVLSSAKLAASSSTSAASTTTITISIPASQQLPNPAALLPPSTAATLSALHASHRAPLSTSNTFVFSNVSAGSYLLDVHCTTHAFAPLRVDVLASPVAAAGGSQEKKKDRLTVAAWETFRGNDWDNKGEAAARNGGFEVKLLGPKGYYMERSGFSVLSILKNPMILIAIVTMGIFIGMPYLLENMDPEVRAEFEARQKNSPVNAVLGGATGGGSGGANPMGNFDMAAFLAGSSSSKKDDSGSGPATPASSGGKKGGRR